MTLGDLVIDVVDKLDYPPLLKQISDKLEEANRQ